MALIVIPLALFIPAMTWLFQWREDGVLDVVLATLASFVAGVSVFGSENAIGSRRFLVHHGVTAGSVWWRRFTAWGVLMTLILVLATYATLHSPGSLFIPGFSSHAARIYILICSTTNAFAIAMPCGMAIRRRITAVLLSAMLWVVVVPPQFGLHSIEIFPAWSLALVPLILVAISAGWAKDWLVEPEGARRWLRLSMLLVVPFSLLFAAFVGYRAFGVPNFSPVFDSSILNQAAIPREQNAAEVYRKAGDLILAGKSVTIQSAIENGWQDDENMLTKFLSANQPVLELTKKASLMPRFEPIHRMTSTSENWPFVRGLQLFEQLLALEMRQRQANGNLLGAWDDLMAIFRLANQLVETNPTIARSQTANSLHHQAIGLAFEWLADSHQDPATIRKALAELKALPELPDLSRALKVQSYLDEKTLDLPGDELAVLLFYTGEKKKPEPLQFLVLSRLICAPWERMRARRICRKVFSECIVTASVEPYQRSPGGFNSVFDHRTSMLVPSFLNSIPQVAEGLDSEIVSRRALIQAVALVAWKLEHDGKDADKLTDLVPGLLDKLPIDPYSGQPFGYLKSTGQMIWRPMDMNNWQVLLQKPSRVGQMLLYSVGPDGRDDRSETAYRDRVYPLIGDIIYAIP